MSLVVNISDSLSVSPSGYTGKTNIANENTTYPWSRGYNNASYTTNYARFLLNASSTSTDCYIYYTFDLSDIPAQATIDSVTCSARISRNSRVGSSTILLYNGTTAKGASTSFSSTNTTGTNVTPTSISNTGSWTRTELLNARIRITGRRTSTNQTGYIYFWGATLTVSYSITGTLYDITSTLTTDTVDSISPSGLTQLMGGNSYELTINAADVSDFIVEDNGIDVTSSLVIHNSLATTSTFTGIPTSFDSTNSVYDTTGGDSGNGIYSTNYIENGLTDHNSSTRCALYSVQGSNAASYMYYNFDCSSIPANAVITSVSCLFKGGTLGSTYYSSYTAQLTTGTTLKGTALSISGTNSSPSTVTISGGSSWTRAELNNIKIKFQVVRGTSNTTTGSTWSFFGATLIVQYLIPVENPYYWTYTISNVSADHTIEVKDAIRTFIKLNNAWQNITKIYKKISGSWVELDKANIPNLLLSVNNIIFYEGSLVIPITLTSASDLKVYDGVSLNNDTVLVTSGSFELGDSATYSNFASQTLVGQTQNTFDYTINPQASSDKYVITKQYGTLKVTDGTDPNDIDELDTDLVIVLTETSEPESISGYIAGETVTYNVYVTNIYNSTESFTLSGSLGLTLSLNSGSLTAGLTATYTAQHTITSAEVTNGYSTQTVSITIGNITKTATCTVDIGVHDFSEDYLTTKAVNAGYTSLVVYGHQEATASGEPVSVSYSLDNGHTWTTETSPNDDVTESFRVVTPYLTVGQKVLWKANIVKGCPSTSFATFSREFPYYGCVRFVHHTVSTLEVVPKGSGISSGSPGRYEVMGNIASLAYGDNFLNQNIPNVQSACLGLFVAIDGSSTEYYSHSGKLTDASNLVLYPDTVSYCYNSMFGNLNYLLYAPELPAITLADHCYAGMFSGCALLTIAPRIYGTTLNTSCCENMFRYCTSLTTAYQLPATTLTTSCYASMFMGCSSLTTIPSNMLPATSLVSSCYESMFLGCTSLTTAPDLLAISLPYYCYRYMFLNCSSLNYIKALFTTSPGKRCTSWVTGVASTGTFVKNVNATWTDEGDSGVPTGWTVQTVSP